MTHSLLLIYERNVTFTVCCWCAPPPPPPPPPPPLFSFYQNPGDKAAIANAFKYFTGISLVILSSFGKIAKDLSADEDIGYFWGYVMCYTFSTLYSWCWDLFMDWGLLVCTKRRSTIKLHLTSATTATTESALPAYQHHCCVSFSCYC